MTPKKDAYMRGYGDGFKDAKVVTDAMVSTAQDAWIKARLKSAGNHRTAMRSALEAALLGRSKTDD